MIYPGESSARNPSNNHRSTIPSFFRKLKNNEHVIMALLAVVVGFGALGFRLLIELFQFIVYPGKGNVLEVALERISPKDFSILPVVSKENRKELLGIVTRRDIIGAYNSAVIKKPILSE